ncbi:MAG: hypothetical protein Kow0056_12350 [Coriobacteriia bacterium]
MEGQERPQESLSRSERRRARKRGVRVRTLVVGMVTVVLLAAVAIAWLVFWPRDDGAGLKPHPRESTETVSFAGYFPVEGEEPLAGPLSIAFDGRYLYVAEADAGSIRVYSPNGGLRGTIPLPADEELGGEDARAYPVDLAVVDEGRLAVVDTARRKVMLVGITLPDLVEISAVGSQDGTAPVAPTAVAYSQGRVIVADAEGPRLLAYDLAGRFLEEVRPSADPPLGVVSALAARDGLLYATDSASGRVAVLDVGTGEVLRFLDKQMGLPRGVDFDAAGRAYVADRFEGVIEVFDADGSDLESFGDGSRTGAALSMPNDVVWLEDKSRLYVADAALGRIVVYNVVDHR